MKIDELRQDLYIVIWANPRGVFVTVTDDKNDEEAKNEFDALKFTSWLQAMRWIGRHAIEAKE